MLVRSPNLVCNLSIELGKKIASRRIIIDVTLHGVSLKSNSHLFYIHGVMFQASGKFHPFSIEFACMPLCHICTLGD